MNEPMLHDAECDVVLDKPTYTIKFFKLKGGEVYKLSEKHAVSERLYISSGEILLQYFLVGELVSKVLVEGDGDIGKHAIGSQPLIVALTNNVHLIDIHIREANELLE